VESQPRGEIPVWNTLQFEFSLVDSKNSTLQIIISFGFWPKSGQIPGIQQISMILLQVDSAALGDAPREVKLTMFQLLVEGGWTMIPIFILFIIAIFIFVERYLNIRQANADPGSFMQTVRSYVISGNIEQAKLFCQQENSPFARMILKGIHRLGSPVRDIEAAIENVGSLEIFRLEKRMSILATCAGAAPMLGFFGTVLGMLQGFMTIAHLEGNVSPSKLAEPIYIAMVTTVGGLIVGIFAYIGYNMLVTMVSNAIYKMEATSMEFIDLLQEPAK